MYEELRGELDGSYFEDLLRELVLQNDHMALVELVPVDAPRVRRVPRTPSWPKRDAMTDAELADVVERTAVLRAAQEAEDTPEAKATLPRLRVSDIARRAPSRRWSWTPLLPSPVCATASPPTVWPTPCSIST